MTREEAIRYGNEWLKDEYLDAKDGAFIKMAIKALDKDPKPVDYYDCSSAMLKLWMENIVADSEYYRIIDKLNARHKEGKI